MTRNSHLAGRWFLFGLGLIISLGKIKFWILPNLDNEKLGFVESFKPFYSFEYKDASKGSKGKKKRKDKDKGTTVGEKASKETENASKDEDQGEEEEEDAKESEDTSEKVENNEGTEQTEQTAS